MRRCSLAGLLPHWALAGLLPRWVAAPLGAGWDAAPLGPPARGALTSGFPRVEWIMVISVAGFDHNPLHVKLFSTPRSVEAQNGVG